MAYKYSKGDRKFNDITAENDIDGNTKIDFDEDYIAMQAGGSSTLVVSGSKVGVGTTAPTEVLTINGAEGQSDETFIKFTENNDDRALIGINSSNNILIENLFSNKHIVFKASDAGVSREGLRLDGAVPEVVVNQTSDSLVDFRVESDNNTHMLYVDGGNDKIGINQSQPAATLDINGSAKVQLDLSVVGEITAATQPAFLARKQSNNQDQFAINTGVDVTLGLEDFDVGSNFASNTFTAPTTGVYIFTANVYLTNLDTDATNYSLDLVTTAGTYRLAIIDPGAFSTDVGEYTLNGSMPLLLAAGDTAKIQVYQSGGTQQTNIRGAGTRGTFFAGYLLG